LLPLQHPDGSAYIEQGNTKVLVVIYGPHEPKHKSQLSSQKALIHVEFMITPFSTSERKKRSKTDK
jgi:exosome complex component RRP41